MPALLQEVCQEIEAGVAPEDAQQREAVPLPRGRLHQGLLCQPDVASPPQAGSPRQPAFVEALRPEASEPQQPRAQRRSADAAADHPDAFGQRSLRTALGG